MTPALRFVLRDDDTSFFTQPDHLEAAYRMVPREVPVSLAVIPFDVPSFNRGNKETFVQAQRPEAVSANTALVDYIREKGSRFHVMLHGFNHLYSRQHDRWVGEFEEIGFGAARRAIELGARELETAFRRQISEFVPPSNAISLGAARALGAAEFLLMGTLNRWRHLRAPANWRQLARLRKAPRFFVRRFTTHAEIPCRVLTPLASLQQLKHEMDACAGFQGTFVLGTHYWEFSETCRENLRSVGDNLSELIDYAARRHGANFISADRIPGHQRRGAAVPELAAKPD